MPQRKKRKLSPIHPGEALGEILQEAALSANALALALRLPANRITKILRGERGITADTAMRLARYFGTSAEMWMNLQAKYDLDAAEDQLRERVEREVLPRSAAFCNGPPRARISASDRRLPSVTIAAKFSMCVMWYSFGRARTVVTIRPTKPQKSGGAAWIHQGGKETARRHSGAG